LLHVLGPHGVGIAGGGVVEEDGVFAHEVVDLVRLAADGQLVLAHRIEAEEGFGVVDQVELASTS
jgi:hypothetical protein